MPGDDEARRNAGLSWLQELTKGENELEAVVSQSVPQPAAQKNIDFAALREASKGVFGSSSSFGVNRASNGVSASDLQGTSPGDVASASCPAGPPETRGDESTTAEEKQQKEEFMQAMREGMARAKANSQPGSTVLMPVKEDPTLASVKQAQDIKVRSDNMRKFGNEYYPSEIADRLDAVIKEDTPQDQKSMQQRQVFEEAKEKGMEEKRKAEEKAAQFAIPTEVKKPGATAGETLPQWISPELYEEYDYPKYDPKYRDKEYVKSEMMEEMVDPRKNPNLYRDQNDPEFWYNAARKPFNKTLLRSENHWEKRRSLWLNQFHRVQEMNKKRQEIAELLEDCPNDVKRLITPIMKFKITESVLVNALEIAKEQKRDFVELVQTAEYFEKLKLIRNRVDSHGAQAAEEMMQHFDAQCMEESYKKINNRVDEERQERRVADMTTLQQAINWGIKCKKDGLIEWENNNWAEAHAAWYQADMALRKFKAPDKDESENKMLVELHSAVLKNLAAACLKLEYYTDALEAADAALVLDPDDYKAWFRRASSLEGLGRIDEAEVCLKKIEDAAVGRTDAVRIKKDVKAKREKYQALRDRDDATGKKMLERALYKGIFGEDRTKKLEGRPHPVVDSETKKQVEDDSKKEDEETTGAADQKPVPSLRDLVASDPNRMKLTRDGVEDLLQELLNVFSDTLYQKQILKLSRDVGKSVTQFLIHLPKVAVPVQRPVLEKWGFEVSERGIQEMRLAVEDHIKGSDKAAERLRQRDAQVKRALYGTMYSVMNRPDDAQHQPLMQVAFNHSPTQQEDESD